MSRTLPKSLIGIGLLAALVLAGGALRAGQSKTRPASAPATGPAKVDIKVGRATTFILGPLNADGTVNYVAAINARAAKGVTPANNAAVLLLRAIGPEMLEKQVRQRTFKALGIKPLPEKGAYFNYLYEHAEAHAPKDPDEASAFREKLEEAFDAAMGGPWKTVDHPIIAAWLTANAKPLAQAVAASKRPRYYLPLLSPADPPRMLDTVKALLASINCRSLAKAMIARAMLKAGSGDSAGARGDLLTLHRLARHIGQDPTILGRLVGRSIEDLANAADTTLATSGKLSAAELKAHLTGLAALLDLPGVVKAMDQGDRFFSLDFVQVCAREGLRKGLTGYSGQEIKDADSDIKSVFASLAEAPVHWNVVLASENRWTDRIVEAMSKKTFAQRRRASDALLAEVKQLRTRTTDRKKLAARIRALERMTPAEARAERGRMIADFLASVPLVDLPVELPFVTHCRVLHDRAAMSRQLAQLALALAAHKADRGKYPKTLKELAPAYVKKVPEDLFVNKPLHYARDGKGYCLYSVGENMKDDSGEDDPNDGDLVVRAAR